MKDGAVVRAIFSVVKGIVWVLFLPFIAFVACVRDVIKGG